jgi:NADPH:quinone reductase-like Zn-dependent oxidoreductase
VVGADDIAPKPARLDFDQAAGLVTGGVTALRVVRAAGIEKGQTVLVQGGAGGVGTPLVQILHERGATVLATASARNSDYLKSLGVDRVIDYTAAPFEESVSNVDVVLDLVGGDVTTRSVKVVKPGGVLITIANRPPVDACAVAQIRCPAFAHPDAPIGPDMRELSALADAGKLQIHVDKVFPLAEAAAAQQLSEAGRTRGKIVLRIP